jgi:hypothetical protein
MSKNQNVVSKTINLSVTRLQKTPCLYERGGFNVRTNRGFAIIVTNKEGRKKFAIALRDEINNRHALIPIAKGDICVEAIIDRNNAALEGEVCVNIWEINNITVTDGDNGAVMGDAEIVLLNNHSFGIWSNEDGLLKKLEEAIKVAKEKCTTKECNKAMYVQAKKQFHKK